MKPIHTSLLIMAVWSFFSTALFSQQLWVVDDDFQAGVDFVNLQTAVDYALEGDTLLIKDGTYGGFHIDGKSLTLVAEEGASATVNSLAEVTNLLVGQAVHLKGLKFQSTASDALHLTDCTGVVELESCQVHGANGPASVGIRLESVESVLMFRCSIRGGDLNQPVVLDGTTSHGGDAIVSTDSNLFLVRCEVEGESGSNMDTYPGDGGDGGLGAHVLGGTFFAQDSSIQGGHGGKGFGTLVIGCGDGGNGNQGVLMEMDSVSGSIPSANVHNTNVAGGALGDVYMTGQFGCAVGLPGLDWMVNAGSYNSTTGDSLEFVAPMVLRTDEWGFLTFRGNPGTAISLSYSTSIAPLWNAIDLGIDALSNPATVPIGAIPAWGTLNFAFQRRLPQGVLGRTYQLQAVGSLGGITVLGDIVSLTLLDPRY